MNLKLLAATAVMAALLPLRDAPVALAQGARAGVSGMRTVEVRGSAEAYASPDVAYLNLGIETHAPTAEQSSGRNAALARKVVQALKSKLAGKGKVWTGGYSLSPEYARRSGRAKPAIIGYTARNSITVRTGATAALGALIDAAIAAGANRVNSLSFTLKDDTKPRSEAIAKATHDAEAQARALAGALGVTLRRVVKASTVAEVRPIRVAQPMRMAMAAKVPTEIEPSQVTGPATVSLIYEIE